MKTIISDTTALIILTKSNHFNLLTNIFDTVYIPSAVMNEIRYKNDIVQILVESSDIIKVREVTNQEILADIQTTNLDLGETEAIALALEMDLRLIIDEKKGRKIAEQNGVRIIGLLGILEANYRLGDISYRELLYILEDFKRVNYRLSPILERAFLDGINPKNLDIIVKI
jgi:predicted nucleic acid-binding protein